MYIIIFIKNKKQKKTKLGRGHCPPSPTVTLSLGSFLGITRTYGG